MTRIGEKFKELGEKGEKALIAFITAGDPDLEFTGECILEMEKGGADIIELGVPFSDPMADGPTIQKSSERALTAGTTLPKILAMVKSVRQRSRVPIVLMGYFNPVFRFGVAKFAAAAVAAGVDGVLLVDLPPEEAGEFKKAAAAAGLDLISLLTPTSDAGRIAKVAELGSGFIYYVSVTGVTGARQSVADSMFGKVAEIREKSPLPVAVGFGISDPVQAARVASVADGVVVGSAIVKLFEEFSGEELKSRLRGFVAELKAGIGNC
ncbi:MAG: tryptophan synthase subunit alpha [Geobacteraceae bacterium]|nr:tryptophan synthase subunit alpha [Geobacteraceae bacterium]